MAGQVLEELILKGLQAVSIGGAGAEAGDVETWGVWQVDGEGLWQHQELVFLQGYGRAMVSAWAGGWGAGLPKSL